MEELIEKPLILGYFRPSDINAKWLCGLDVPKYKKSIPNNEDGLKDEQEQRIMNLVGQMNTVQKDFLLALLHTVVVQNQGTSASNSCVS